MDNDQRLIWEAYSLQEEGIKGWLAAIGVCLFGGCVSPNIEPPDFDKLSKDIEVYNELSAEEKHRLQFDSTHKLNKTMYPYGDVRVMRWYRSYDQLDTGTIVRGREGSFKILNPAELEETLEAGIELLLEDKRFDDNLAIYYPILDAHINELMTNSDTPVGNMFKKIKSLAKGNLDDKSIGYLISNWGPDPDLGWEGWPKYIHRWWIEEGSKIDISLYAQK